MRSAIRRVLSVALAVVMIAAFMPVIHADGVPVTSEVYIANGKGGIAVYAQIPGGSNVQFPTWTSYNGQDDLVWYNVPSGSWTIGGVTYNYAIWFPISDHNNEGGVYIVHIYSGGALVGTTTVNVNTSPTIVRAKAVQSGTSGYNVYVYAADNGTSPITRVAFPTWTDANGQDDIIWRDGTAGSWTIDGQTYNYSFYVAFSDHGNQTGTYITDPYAYNALGLNSGSRVTLTPNFAKPAVTAYTRVQNGDNGFWIYAAVDTNGGLPIDRVQFPTWTDKNGQDDIQSDWQYNSAASGTAGSWTVDGTAYNYRYYVAASAHNNEYEGYLTDIYPYNTAGLCQARGAGSFTFDLKPSVEAVAFEQDGAAGFRAYARVSTNGNGAISRVAFPTWTVEGHQDDIVWKDGTAGSWTVKGGSYNYSCYISAADHNNDHSRYQTDVYAWNVHNAQSSGLTLLSDFSFALNVDPGDGEWNGTAGSSTVSGVYGSAVTVADPVPAEGYDFTDWSKTGEGAWDAAGKTYTYGAGNGSLTANHRLNTYTITWKNADGTELGTTTAEHGEVPSYSITPTKDCDGDHHYSFSGWSPAPSAAAGPETYTAVFDADDHTYTDPSYSWEGASCTAARSCSCGYTQTETVAGTGAVKVPATCVTKGTTTYTAVFENAAFATQTKDIRDIPMDSSNHDYAFDSFVWAEDNTAKAKLVCSRDSGHESLVETEVTGVPYPATCGQNAYTVYTATYGDHTEDKTVIAADTALAHNYQFDSFVWADDNRTAQVKVICANCQDEKLVDAEMSEDAHDPTCAAAGYTDYTAAYGGHTATKRVAGEAATGHVYAEPDEADWTWTATEDGYTATVDVNCVKNDDPQTLTATVALTDSKDAGHLTDGYKTYTAAAAIGDQTFTAVKTDVIEAEGHSLSHHDAVPAANCTETGTIEYWSCAGCDALFADEDAQNEITDISDGVYGPHAYAFDSFVWAADGATAQAKYICANNPEHVKLYDADMSSSAIAPTCTAAGYTDYTAAYDGHTDTNQVAGDAATGHTYAEPEEADWTWTAAADGYTATVDVNCVKNDDPQTLTATVSLTDSEDAGHLTDGFKTYTATATIGDQTFTAVKTDVIEAEGHSTVHHAAVPAAKCTETGTIEYWSCSGCDKLFSDENAQNEITDISDNTAGPHDYAFDSFVWAADGATAKAKYVCRNSAEHTALYDAEMSADAHGPTCTAAGYTDYTAAYDGHTETNRVAGDAATDHDYEATEWIWAEDNSGATATLVCKNDPTHTRELTAVVTHTEDTATEYEGGVIVYTATATIPDTEISFTDTKTVETAPLGHTHVYGEWIEEVGATCEGAGTLGHYTCSGCGAYFDAEYNEIEDLTIPAKGHRWGAPVITFSEDGRTATATRICANADHPDTKDAAVTGEVTKAATCTEVGETTYTATAEFDGVTYTDTKTVADVPALRHSWSEPVFTFSEDGKAATATRTCANADHPETKAAAVTGEVTTPATCTGRGKTTYTAAVIFDGETYTSTKTVEDVAANGHSWDGGAVLTEPTCTGAGVFVYTCAACGATREETLGALGHDWDRGEVTKPATTTETGVRTYTCSRCGETRTETIGKLGSCPICNAPHNKNLLDRIVGLIHSIIYFLVTFNRTF